MAATPIAYRAGRRAEIDFSLNTARLSVNHSLKTISAKCRGHHPLQGSKCLPGTSSTLVIRENSGPAHLSRVTPRIIRFYVVSSPLLVWRRYFFYIFLYESLLNVHHASERDNGNYGRGLRKEDNRRGKAFGGAESHSKLFEGCWMDFR